MERNTPHPIEPVRMETGRPLLLAGLNVRYAFAPGQGLPTREAIPEQWRRFEAHMNAFPARVGAEAYGACSNFDDRGRFDYLCGVEVEAGSVPPAGCTQLRVEAQRYAVFAHRGSVLNIAGTWDAILHWMQESAHCGVKAPQLEIYGPAFDARTGLGGLEIWIPIQ